MKRMLTSWSLLCLVLAFLPTATCRPADDDGKLDLNPTKHGVGSVKCITEDDLKRPGVCIEYKYCYQNYSIIKYAEPDDYEIRKSKQCGEDEWCCADDIITPEEIAAGRQPPQHAVPKPTPKPMSPTDSSKPNTTDSRGGPDVNVTVNFRTGLGCGMPADGLRQGSADADYGECPWCAALFRDGGNPRTMDTNGYFCTGSLIHPRVVLTAASCLKAAKDVNVSVRVGDYDLQQTTELFPYQELAVQDRVIHEDYNSGTKKNNIALLILSKAALIQDNVNTACLPRAGETVLRPGTCYAYAWGKDKAGVYRNPTAKVPLSQTDKVGCQTALQSAGASNGYMVDDTSFCAQASPDVDACPVNHGAPFTCVSEKDKFRFVQYGLSSWTPRCALGSPGVYSDLASLRAWVDEQMSKRAFDTATYTL